MQLRPFYPADIDEVVRIEKVCFSEYLAWDHEEYIKNIYNSKNESHMQIVDVGDQIGGFILLDVCEDTGHITTLNVDIPFRGCGLAKYMMEWAHRFFLSTKKKYISLEVDTKNDAAVGLYRSLGYLVVTEVEDYYDEGIPAFVMIKKL